jgi:plasmid stabilization system protein ParE
MGYEIIWSPEAIDSFDGVIDYLKERWTEKEAKKFVTITENTINHISQNPYLFKGSEKDNLREAVITKQNILLYQINESLKIVELLIFWDTRQNPKRKYTRKK